MSTNNAIGKAGEFRIASELLLRGFTPLLSVVDEGIDIILAEGPRIQAKASHLGTPSRQKEGYTFSFKSWVREKGTRRQLPHPLVGVDFVILWAIDDDVFLIIPAGNVRGRGNIRFSTTERPRNHWHSYEGAWHLLEEYWASHT